MVDCPARFVQTAQLLGLHSTAVLLELKIMLRFHAIPRTQLLALVTCVESCPPHDRETPEMHTTLAPLSAAKHAKFSQKTIIFAKFVKLLC
jgi:hypothetical protein